MEWINQALLAIAFVDIVVDIGINVDIKLDCKRVLILRIQVRANSQTKSLERGWKQRARLLGRIARVWHSRYAKPILRKNRLFCSLLSVMNSCRFTPEDSNWVFMQVIKTYHPLENFRLRITWVNCFFFSILRHFLQRCHFTISADYGAKTCAGYPGSVNHVNKDAQVSTLFIISGDNLDLDFTMG